MHAQRTILLLLALFTRAAAGTTLWQSHTRIEVRLLNNDLALSNTNSTIMVGDRIQLKCTTNYSTAFQNVAPALINADEWEYAVKFANGSLATAKPILSAGTRELYTIIELELSSQHDFGFLRCGLNASRSSPGASNASFLMANIPPLDGRVTAALVLRGWTQFSLDYEEQSPTPPTEQLVAQPHTKHQLQRTMRVPMLLDRLCSGTLPLQPTPIPIVAELPPDTDPANCTAKRLLDSLSTMGRWDIILYQVIPSAPIPVVNISNAVLVSGVQTRVIPPDVIWRPRFLFYPIIETWTPASQGLWNISLRMEERSRTLELVNVSYQVYTTPDVSSIHGFLPLTIVRRRRSAPSTRRMFIRSYPTIPPVTLRYAPTTNCSLSFLPAWMRQAVIDSNPPPANTSLPSYFRPFDPVLNPQGFNQSHTGLIYFTGHPAWYDHPEWATAYSRCVQPIVHAATGDIYAEGIWAMNAAKANFALTPELPSPFPADSPPQLLDVRRYSGCSTSSMEFFINGVFRHCISLPPPSTPGTGSSTNATNTTAPDFMELQFGVNMSQRVPRIACAEHASEFNYAWSWTQDSVPAPEAFAVNQTNVRSLYRRNNLGLYVQFVCSNVPVPIPSWAQFHAPMLQVDRDMAAPPFMVVGSNMPHWPVSYDNATLHLPPIRQGKALRASFFLETTSEEATLHMVFRLRSQPTIHNSTGLHTPFASPFASVAASPSPPIPGHYLADPHATRSIVVLSTWTAHFRTTVSSHADGVRLYRVDMPGIVIDAAVFHRYEHTGFVPETQADVRPDMAYEVVDVFLPHVGYEDTGSYVLCAYTAAGEVCDSSNVLQLAVFVPPTRLRCDTFSQGAPAHASLMDVRPVFPPCTPIPTSGPLTVHVGDIGTASLGRLLAGNGGPNNCSSNLGSGGETSTGLGNSSATLNVRGKVITAVAGLLGRVSATTCNRSSCLELQTGWANETVAGTVASSGNTEQSSALRVLRQLGLLQHELQSTRACGDALYDWIMYNGVFSPSVSDSVAAEALCVVWMRAVGTDGLSMAGLSWEAKARWPGTRHATVVLDFEVQIPDSNVPSPAPVDPQTRRLTGSGDGGHQYEIHTANESVLVPSADVWSWMGVSQPNTSSPVPRPKHQWIRHNLSAMLNGSQPALHRRHISSLGMVVEGVGAGQNNFWTRLWAVPDTGVGNQVQQAMWRGAVMGATVSARILWRVETLTGIVTTTPQCARAALRAEPTGGGGTQGHISWLAYAANASAIGRGGEAGQAPDGISYCTIKDDLLTVNVTASSSHRVLLPSATPTTVPTPIPSTTPSSPGIAMSTPAVTPSITALSTPPASVTPTPNGPATRSPVGTPPAGAPAYPAFVKWQLFGDGSVQIEAQLTSLGQPASSPSQTSSNEPNPVPSTSTTSTTGTAGATAGRRVQNADINTDVGTDRQRTGHRQASDAVTTVSSGVTVVCENSDLSAAGAGRAGVGAQIVGALWLMLDVWLLIVILSAGRLHRQQLGEAKITAGNDMYQHIWVISAVLSLLLVVMPTSTDQATAAGSVLGGLQQASASKLTWAVGLWGPRWMGSRSSGQAAWRSGSVPMDLMIQSTNQSTGTTSLQIPLAISSLAHDPESCAVRLLSSTHTVGGDSIDTTNTTNSVTQTEFSTNAAFLFQWNTGTNQTSEHLRNLAVPWQLIGTMQTVGDWGLSGAGSDMSVPLRAAATTAVSLLMMVGVQVIWAAAVWAWCRWCPRTLSDHQISRLQRCMVHGYRLGVTARAAWVMALWCTVQVLGMGLVLHNAIASHTSLLEKAVFWILTIVSGTCTVVCIGRSVWSSLQQSLTTTSSPTNAWVKYPAIGLLSAVIAAWAISSHVPRLSVVQSSPPHPAVLTATTSSMPVMALIAVVCVITMVLLSLAAAAWRARGWLKQRIVDTAGRRQSKQTNGNTGDEVSASNHSRLSAVLGVADEPRRAVAASHSQQLNWYHRMRAAVVQRYLSPTTLLQALPNSAQSRRIVRCHLIVYCMMLSVVLLVTATWFSGPSMDRGQAEGIIPVIVWLMAILWLMVSLLGVSIYAIDTYSRTERNTRHASLKGYGVTPAVDDSSTGDSKGQGAGRFESVLDWYHGTKKKQRLASITEASGDGKTKNKRGRGGGRHKRHSSILRRPEANRAAGVANPSHKRPDIPSTTPPLGLRTDLTVFTGPWCDIPLNSSEESGQRKSRGSDSSEDFTPTAVHQHSLQVLHGSPPRRQQQAPAQVYEDTSAADGYDEYGDSDSSCSVDGPPICRAGNEYGEGLDTQSRHWDCMPLSPQAVAIQLASPSTPRHLTAQHRALPSPMIRSLEDRHAALGAHVSSAADENPTASGPNRSTKPAASGSNTSYCSKPVRQHSSGQTIATERHLAVGADRSSSATVTGLEVEPLEEVQPELSFSWVKQLAAGIRLLRSPRRKTKSKSGGGRSGGLGSPLARQVRLSDAAEAAATVAESTTSTSTDGNANASSSQTTFGRSSAAAHLLRRKSKRPAPKGTVLPPRRTSNHLAPAERKPVPPSAKSLPTVDKRRENAKAGSEPSSARSPAVGRAQVAVSPSPKFSSTQAQRAVCHPVPSPERVQRMAPLLRHSQMEALQRANGSIVQGHAVPEAVTLDQSMSGSDLSEAVGNALRLAKAATEQAQRPHQHGMCNSNLKAAVAVAAGSSSQLQVIPGASAQLQRSCTSDGVVSVPHEQPLVGNSGVTSGNPAAQGDIAPALELQDIAPALALQDAAPALTLEDASFHQRTLALAASSSSLQLTQAQTNLVQAQTAQLQAQATLALTNRAVDWSQEAQTQSETASALVGALQRSASPRRRLQNRRASVPAAAHMPAPLPRPLLRGITEEQLACLNEWQKGGSASSVAAYPLLHDHDGHGVQQPAKQIPYPASGAALAGFHDRRGRIWAMQSSTAVASSAASSDDDVSIVSAPPTDPWPSPPPSPPPALVTTKQTSSGAPSKQQVEAEHEHHWDAESVMSTDTGLWGVSTLSPKAARDMREAASAANNRDLVERRRRVSLVIPPSDSRHATRFGRHHGRSSHSRRPYTAAAASVQPSSRPPTHRSHAGNHRRPSVASTTSDRRSVNSLASGYSTPSDLDPQWRVLWNMRRRRGSLPESLQFNKFVMAMLGRTQPRPEP